MTFQSDLDVPLVLNVVTDFKNAAALEYAVQHFVPAFTNLKRKNAQLCVFYPRGHNNYAMIELSTMGRWMALNPEISAIPTINTLLQGTIFARIFFSSVIPSMVSMVEEWKTYPTVEATYKNTRGSITECTIPPAGDYMVLVCFLAFVDDTTKNRWSSGFESRILATSQEQRSPVSIFLDTAQLAGIVITIDSAEHWLSSGALIPGVVSSVSAGNSLDEGVASVTVHHVYCGEASEYSHVTDRIASCVRGVQECSYESFKAYPGSFIGNTEAE